jgi:hypothetical protein
MLGPYLVSKVGATVACLQVVPSRYQPLVVSQAVQTAWLVRHSLQLVSSQGTIVPSVIFGPNFSANFGVSVLCLQVSPSRYQPLVVLHEEHLEKSDLQDMQWETAQDSIIPFTRLAPNKSGISGSAVGLLQTVP